MTNNAQDKWLKMDLQMFSDGEVYRGGYNPEAEISFPSPESNPLLQDSDPIFQPEPVDPEPVVPGAEPQPGQEIVQPPVQPEPTVFDFGGRKVNPNDPASIQGAYEDFVRAQAYITQLTQQNQQLMMNQQQFQQQQFQQPPAQPEPQEEPFDADAFMEKLYEDPKAAIQSITQKAIEEAVASVRAEYEPIVKERQYNDEISRVESKYPDFTDTIPAIQEIIAERGEDFVGQVGLETVYLMAKGRTSVGQQQQPMTPETLLQDPTFIQQLVSNEQVKNLILQQTMGQKLEQRPPQVIKNNVGGAVPLSPTNRPKTLQEASKLWRESQGIY